MKCAWAIPQDYLFRNTDPRGSLRANVRNAAVRYLSNMPLQSLLEDRHGMSRRVREEVSPKSDAGDSILALFTFARCTLGTIK